MREIEGSYSKLNESSNNMNVLDQDSHSQKESFRKKLLHIIHGKYVHYTILLLLLLDVIFVVVSIFIEILILHNQVQSQKNMLELCIDIPAKCSADVHNDENKSYHKTEIILAYFSIVILSIFIVEHMLLIYAEGIKYFKSIMNILDCIVILFSFIQELMHFGKLEGGILILVRIWRFVRIGHGIYEVSHPMEEDLHNLKNTVEKAENDGIYEEENTKKKNEAMNFLILGVKKFIENNEKKEN